MTTTTVLLGNAVLLVASGYAFNERRYRSIKWIIIANLLFMLYDFILRGLVFDIAVSSNDYTMYYSYLSAFFVIVAFVFITKYTGMSLIFAGCLLAQSFSCFLMSINGFEIDQLNGVTLPEYGIINDIHGLVNSLVWVVEIATVLNVEVGKVWRAVMTTRQGL